MGGKLGVSNTRGSRCTSWSPTTSTIVPTPGPVSQTMIPTTTTIKSEIKILRLLQTGRAAGSMQKQKQKQKQQKMKKKTLHTTRGFFFTFRTFDSAIGLARSTQFSLAIAASGGNLSVVSLGNTLEMLGISDPGSTRFHSSLRVFFSPPIGSIEYASTGLEPYRAEYYTSSLDQIRKKIIGMSMTGCWVTHPRQRTA